jgi:heterodisulfide reductase subunit A
LAEVVDGESPYQDVSREVPRVAVALCTCGGALGQAADVQAVAEKLKQSGSGSVSHVFEIERMCTKEGWSELEEKLRESRANRVLMGACQPYLYSRKLKDLGKTIALSPTLMDVADIRTPAMGENGENGSMSGRSVYAILSMGVAKLNGADFCLPSSTEVTQRALVVGGGIAGMTAALAIADHGFEVDLVEQNAELGGNLRKLYRTLEGDAPRDLLERTVAAVQKHPHIQVLTNAAVMHSEGRIGHFWTTVESGDTADPLGRTGQVIEHGVTILATGGHEAKTQSYGYGQSESIMTQHELEEKLQSGSLNPAGLESVAMIQCVDSREEGRGYCSRICCGSALKNALFLKERNPELDVYILNRDIMAYGFLEAYYTKARKAGVIFIQYKPEEKPEVTVENGRPTLKAKDPILGRDLIFKPDLLVLSTGMVPSDHRQLAEIFGAAVNGDGFLQEAESKWRPVDFLKEGTYLCGIAHSPRFITESIATAEAAAQRALSILGRRHLAAGSTVAEVRHSLCSQCEKCITACPYGARWKDEDEEKIVVNELVCQGCGSCAAVCPNSASLLRGYRDQQIFAVLDAALEDCA